MTTPQAYVVIVIAVVGTVVCAWQTRRALRAPLERDRIVAEAWLYTSPPVMETAPGTDVALQDACELLWSTPIAPDLSGLDRLRNAIRDHQKGDQA